VLAVCCGSPEQVARVELPLEAAKAFVPCADRRARARALLSRHHQQRHPVVI